MKHSDRQGLLRFQSTHMENSHTYNQCRPNKEQHVNELVAPAPDPLDTCPPQQQLELLGHSGNAAVPLLFSPEGPAATLPCPVPCMPQCNPSGVAYLDATLNVVLDMFVQDATLVVLHVPEALDRGECCTHNRRFPGWVPQPNLALLAEAQMVTLTTLLLLLPKWACNYARGNIIANIAWRQSVRGHCAARSLR